MILETITGALRIVGEFLGLIKKRSDLNNTKEMKERSTAQKENTEDDKDAKAIKDRDASRVSDSIS